MTNLKNIEALDLRIALGLVPGYDKRSAFGRFNGLNTAGSPIVVGSVGTNINWPTTGAVLDIVSTGTGASNDNPTGTGVGTIRITGVDEDFELLTEDVIMNGTTIVNTVNSFLRVDTMVSILAGTLAGYNDAQPIGTITATHGTEIIAQIDAGTGAHLAACFHVPVGKRAVIKDIYTHIDDGGTDVEFFLNVRSNVLPVDVVTIPIIKTKINKSVDGQFIILNITSSNSIVPQYTDVWISADAIGGGSADITATIIYYLTDA